MGATSNITTSARAARLVAPALAVALAAGGAGAGILADSNGDWLLSKAQGFNSWYYGYYDGDAPGQEYSAGDFELMTLGENDWYHADNPRVWTCGTGDWLHPNAVNVKRDDDIHHAVRRWDSYYAGQAQLTGTIHHMYDVPLGDGTDIRILIDGVSVYEATLTPGDITGFAYSVLVDLSVGSKVDYVVTAGANNASPYDTTFISSRITAVPTPGVAAIGLAGAGLLVRRRRPA